MKKSLIALVVLGAFSSIAAAQSSVTLYGRIDQNVTYQDPGKNAAASSGGKLGKGVTKLNDGGPTGFGGSRWGMRGSEDLGDGLRAYFVLESSISGDTGAGGGTTNTSGSSFFNRQSYVALGSKTLGDIRLGRIETLSRENTVRYIDATGDSELSIVEAVATGRPLFQSFGSRVDNGVTYKSPVLGGFQASLIVGLSEDVKVTNAAGVVTAKAAEYRALGATYVGGPISASLSYEEYAGGSASGNYNKAITLGGNYNFGPAVLYAAYQNTSDLGAQAATLPFTKGTDVDAYNVGVKVPYGNFVFKAQFTGSTVDRIGGLSDLDQEKYGLSVGYALSKRTMLYAVVSERSGDNDESYARKNEFVVGLGHNF